MMAGVILAAAGGANAATVTEFSAGITPGSRPEGITAGPDGNLWFTEFDGDRIGRITPTGLVTEYTAGITPGSSPNGITAGPDGNLWFTEFNGGRVGRITPAGGVTEFPVAGSATSLNGITTGPDGNLWYAADSHIGRVTPTGVVTPFSAGISTDSRLEQITPGPDSNLWFTANGGSRVGRVTPGYRHRVPRRPWGERLERHRGRTRPKPVVHRRQRGGQHWADHPIGFRHGVPRQPGRHTPGHRGGSGREPVVHLGRRRDRQGHAGGSRRPVLDRDQYRQ